MVVQKAFKYRFFPTDEQAAQLAKTFGCARYVYNRALEYRTTAWQQEKQSIGYHITSSKLTEWKKEPEKPFFPKSVPLCFNNRCVISMWPSRISSRSGRSIQPSNRSAGANRLAMLRRMRRLAKYSANWNTRRDGVGEPISNWIGSFRRPNCACRVAIY